MKTSYDAIVIGCGGMGASAVFHLARRGLTVLGLEQFTRGHDRGSSHGGSRVVRQVYFEHPDYVPLLRRSFELWHELEAMSGVRLIHRCGVLYAGAPDGEVVAGSRLAAERFGIEHSILSADETMSRWPQFAIPPGLVSLWEPGGGFVRPEAAIYAHLKLAEGHGAIVAEGERVDAIEEERDGVVVHADGGVYRTPRLLLTAGAWTGMLAPALAANVGVALRPTRQTIAWAQPRGPDRVALAQEERLPVWLVEDGAAGPLYGIPIGAGQGAPGGVKFSHHLPGRTIDPDQGAAPVSERERAELEADFARLLPGIAGPVTATATCLYTMTPDGHFIIDRLPGSRRVYVACGFSGHGFKFAPIVGEILADFATTGDTRHPIDFLSWRRFRR